jgi:hypothetical protein
MIARAGHRKLNLFIISPFSMLVIFPLGISEWFLEVELLLRDGETDWPG